jgi:hypothetical protein
MSFRFQVHHILATDVLDAFRVELNSIFRGADKNPFNPDANFNFNKIALVSNPALASILVYFSAIPCDRAYAMTAQTPSDRNTL